MIGFYLHNTHHFLESPSKRTVRYTSINSFILLHFQQVWAWSVLTFWNIAQRHAIKASAQSLKNNSEFTNNLLFWNHARGPSSDGQRLLSIRHGSCPGASFDADQCGSVVIIQAVFGVEEGNFVTWLSVKTSVLVECSVQFIAVPL